IIETVDRVKAPTATRSRDPQRHQGRAEFGPDDNGPPLAARGRADPRHRDLPCDPGRLPIPTRPARDPDPERRGTGLADRHLWVMYLLGYSLDNLSLMALPSPPVFSSASGLWCAK